MEHGTVMEHGTTLNIYICNINSYKTFYTTFIK
jgi:hypothetical protein